MNELSQPVVQNSKFLRESFKEFHPIILQKSKPTPGSSKTHLRARERENYDQVSWKTSQELFAAIFVGCAC